ncbi:cobalt-precorrin-6A reductase [Nocardioides pacificus]
MTVLLLGGTAEARELATALVREGLPVVSSLAGRVSRPRLPEGDVRHGGFGGVDGLAAWLREHDVHALIDATHPFAETMSRHAAEASARTGVPLIRVARPGWSEHPDSGAWHWVEDHETAAQTAARLAAPGRTVLLTIGRQRLDAYLAELGDRPVLARVVDPLEDIDARPVPANWTSVLDRGPYELAGELELMRSHDVAVVVTKDSGGAYTSAKLDAAGRCCAAVVVVRRPAVPQGVELVEGVSQAVEWVRGRL